MLSKLALRNAKRSSRDYLVYLVTVVFSLSLVHAFNSIVFSDEIKALSSGMNAMTMIIIGISCIIVWVIGWLISYMTRFILERRSREFGTYLLLGIPNRAIANLFVRENLIMGGAAFLVSLFTGSLLYQVLEMLIMNVFRADYAIRFQFSLPAAGLTFGYAAVIYLFAMLRVRKKLRRIKICDLLYAEKQNETAALKPGKGHWWLFLMSAAVGAAGLIGLRMLCRAEYPPNHAMLLLCGCILAIILSIYGVYMTLTSLITRTALAGRDYKMKGNRLFLLRNLTARLRTIGITLGTLAMLLTLTLTATTMGLLFERFCMEQKDASASFDVTASSQNPDFDFSILSDYVREHSGIRSEMTFLLHEGDDAIFRWMKELDLPSGWMEFSPVIGYSDYCKMREMLELDPVVLEPGNYILQTTPRIEERIRRETPPALEGLGGSLAMQECRTESLGQSSLVSGTGFFVVTDDRTAEVLPVFHRGYLIQTVTPPSEEDADEISNLTAERYGTDSLDTLNTITSVENSYLSIYTILAFSLYYVGLIFICTAAAVLTVHQLGEASKYRFRYDILSKLGTGKREMKKIVLMQQLIFFGIPLAVPVPLSIFLSRLMTYAVLMNEIRQGVFINSVAISMGLFLGVYLLYFLAAYFGYKKTVLE